MRWVTLLVLLNFLPLLAYCQQSPNFTTLNTKNGLSNNTVNAILKDRYGLLWFGTEDGLNRFDGSTFTVYRHHDNDTTGLLTNQILSLYEDHSGTLWVGITGGALVYYDRVHDQFRRYLGDTFWRTAKNESIRAICEDHLGRLWVSSYTGLRVIDLKTNRTTTFVLSSLNSGNSSEATTALSLFEDRKHRMWIGTNKGLLLFNWNNNSFTRYLYNEKDISSLSNDAVKSINEDHAGNMWFGTMNGLNLLLPDGSFRRFMQDKQSGNSQKQIIYTIAVDHQNLWLGTEDGLAIFNTQNFQTEAIRQTPRNVYSLSGKSVRCVLIDNKGIYWLGTFQGGINKYDPNLALFNLKLCNPFDPLGLKAPAVTSFAELTHDKIFVGTDDGGVQLFDIKTGLLNSIRIDRNNNETTENRLSVMALKYDSRGNLWIGTFQKGLYMYEPKTGRCEHFEAGVGNKHISQNDIFCIEEDKHGRIWIGTNGGGVDIYDPGTKIFTNYIAVFGQSSNGLRLNNYIRAICQGSGGDIWVGSQGSGLGKFNYESKTFTIYNKANSNLTNDGVLSILRDRNGKIWVGTNGAGLNLLDEKIHKFRVYSEKDGLSNAMVQKILEDSRGQLWISTNQGIDSFDPQTAKFNVYTRQNGVQDSPFIMGSGMRTSAGLLLFGGQEGFNYFNPLQLPEFNQIPHVILTDLRVSNNSVAPGKQSPIQEQIGVAKEIRLAYGQNFSIKYIAINYTNAHQDQYSYMLKGFDKDWNYVSRATTAYYTNIDPGTYTFLVRADNQQGKWNAAPTAITIEVFPPWWRTIYAYLLYIFAVAGMLFYTRHKGIQKIKRKLAMEEEKREAIRMHELDLLKINFLTNLSHEFRTPISLIMAPVEKLMSAQSNSVELREIQMIRRNARRLLNLVNQLLDFRKMEEQELKLNLTDADLVDFVKDAVNAFRDLSEQKKISLEFTASVKNLPMRFDQDKIERIVFNLLSNAFKFTKAGGAIRVDLAMVCLNDDEDDRAVKLTITDSGIGIPAGNEHKIFQRFYQLDTSDGILNQGSGIGLAITKEFIQLHGGAIEVKSEKEHGSIFTITLPVIDPVNPAPGVAENIEVPGPAIAETQYDELAEAIELADDNAERDTVLLVEDNDDLRYYLRENLKANYKVIEATNGKEGWQKALSCHPGLIVTDISMPEMNGIELCRKIKTDKRTSFIPVIILTALTGEQDQVSGLKIGANDYLTKPFNFQILNAKVHNLIRLNHRLKNTFSKQITVLNPEVQIESTDEKLLNKVAQFVEDKLNDSECSIEELSKYLCMSRSSLYNKLFELTGLAPVEYVRYIKLQKAAVLLEKSQYTIREIAFMTGFGTPGYFSKLFKAKYNLSPSEYLALKRKDPKSRDRIVYD